MVIDRLVAALHPATIGISIGSGDMRIVMIGTGYVGLVSGVCFSDFGHHVVCVDKDLSKI